MDYPKAPHGRRHPLGRWNPQTDDTHAADNEANASLKAHWPHPAHPGEALHARTHARPWFFPKMHGPHGLRRGGRRRYFCQVSRDLANHTECLVRLAGGTSAQPQRDDRRQVARSLPQSGMVQQRLAASRPPSSSRAPGCLLVRVTYITGWTFCVIQSSGRYRTIWIHLLAWLRLGGRSPTSPIKSGISLRMSWVGSSWLRNGDQRPRLFADFPPMPQSVFGISWITTRIASNGAPIDSCIASVTCSIRPCFCSGVRPSSN